MQVKNQVHISYATLSQKRYLNFLFDKYPSSIF